MKHIRLFEEFDNKLYKKIPNHIGIDYLFNRNRADFNKSHKNQIDELLGKDWVSRFGQYSSPSSNVKCSIYLADKIDQQEGGNWQWVDIKRMNIYEFEDEYYLVYYNHSEYDCAFPKSKVNIVDVVMDNGLDSPLADDWNSLETNELEDESYYWICDGFDGLLEFIQREKRYWQG